MAGSAFPDVGNIKPLRKVEVDLDRGSCPFTAESVDPFDVDLRTVEGAAALVDLELDAVRVHGRSERFLGSIPDLFGSDRFLGTGSEIRLHVVTEDAREVHREVNNAADFVDHLLGAAEDVSIVLSEAADSKHAGQRARALVAVDRAELRQADRQIAI